MRIEGTLTKWNDDRGFGFITPTQGGEEVFVHISMFPKDGRRPMIGERLSFEIQTDEKGRKRAISLLCPDRRPPVRPLRPAVPRHRTQRPGFLGRIVPVLVIALGFYGYKQFSSPATPTAPAESLAADVAPPAEQTNSPTFHCDGRTYCSQMTSCTEAKFFLRNCPNTKMDGNHDGVPCEQQWCTSPFAK